MFFDRMSSAADFALLPSIFTSWWLTSLVSPSTGPRWASWNLGVFLCIRCAGIHRNLGVHISRVKSVNLDSWTPEQMEVSLSLVVQTHFRFSILVLISLLTLLFSLFFFRASSNGEISGPQSFGNVIFKMIFVVLRQIRTIQKYYRFNSNTIFSPRFHASVIMNAPACQIVLSTNCINSLTSLIQPVLYYKAYV